MNKTILTFPVVAENEIFHELASVDAKYRILKKITDTELLLQTEIDYYSFSLRIQQKRFYFTHHLMPVFYEGIFDSDDDLIDRTGGLFSMIPEQASFKVHIRVHNNDYVQPFIINQRLTEMFIFNGNHVSVTDSDYIVSIYIDGNHYYAGAAESSFFLSTRNGGKHHLQWQNYLISRAAFKLIEAIDVFNITINHDTVACDIGASPGGWSSVLLEKGSTVYAVDPSAMDAKLFAHSRFHFIKMHAESFFPTHMMFDFLCNDMRKDAIESAHIMVRAAHCLKENRCAIHTIKLSQNNVITEINKTLDVLENQYAVIQAKHLFHNRREMTVFLKKL